MAGPAGREHGAGSGCGGDGGTVDEAGGACVADRGGGSGRGVGEGGEERGGGARLSSVGASTGATFSSLEFAMADMAALLRKEKGGSVPAPDFYPTPARTSKAAGASDAADAGAASRQREVASSIGGSGGGGSAGSSGTSHTATLSTFGSSGSGGLSTSGSGGRVGGGRVLVARTYVPAAEHAPPAARTEARAVTVRLCADGTLSTGDYHAVRGAYMAAGLPRVDPQAIGEGDDGGRGGGGGVGNTVYARIPAAAQVRL